MRGWLLGIGAFLYIGLAGGYSIPFVVNGIHEEIKAHRAKQAYEIVFKTAGSKCTPGDQQYINIRNGAPLTCTPLSWRGSSGVHLPGFTRAQNDEVATLAEELADDWLTDAEQGRIQDRVNEIAAEVPVADRPYQPGSGVWGTRRALLGVGITATPILGVIALRLWRKRRHSAAQ
jgi:hypothetical protein